MAATAKECSGCEKVKMLGAFAPTQGGKFGRDNLCRPCRRDATALRIARRHKTTPFDKLLAALELDRQMSGTKHSRVSDVYRVMTTTLGYVQK